MLFRKERRKDLSALPDTYRWSPRITFLTSGDSILQRSFLSMNNCMFLATGQPRDRSARTLAPTVFARSVEQMEKPAGYMELGSGSHFARTITTIVILTDATDPFP
jgi:hypothetical protein